MRIACVYHPRVHTGCGKFHFIADALRSLGHDVVHVETLEDLKRADQACELVLFEQRGPASLCIPDLLEFGKQKKAFWVQMYFDLNVFDDALPIEKQSPFEPFLQIAQAMDLVLVKERDRLPEYRAAGVNALWFDQGCPAAMRQAELREHPEFDVVLWGSSSRPMWRQRWEDVETLISAGFAVAWATADGHLPVGTSRLPGCQPLELPDLIERAKVTLVVDARQDLRGYWSDRIWLAAGAGACILRRIATVDNHGSGNLPAWGYGSAKVLVESMHELCDDFGKRQSNGRFARTFTMRGNRYEDRCERLLNYAQNFINQRHENAAVPEVHGDEGHLSNGLQGQAAEAALSGLH